MEILTNVLDQDDHDNNSLYSRKQKRAVRKESTLTCSPQMWGKHKNDDINGDDDDEVYDD